MKTIGRMVLMFTALVLASCDLLDTKENAESIPKEMSKDPDEKLPAGRD